MPSLEKLAKRNKWELNDVVEEAFIHFLNLEDTRLVYIRRKKGKPLKK